VSRTRGRDVDLAETGIYPAAFTFEFAAHSVYDFELNIDGTTPSGAKAPLGHEQACIIAEALGEYFGPDLLTMVADTIRKARADEVLRERNWGESRNDPGCS
jgi:hypothetical protein